MTRFLGEWNCDQLRSTANFSRARARRVVSIKLVGSDALLLMLDDLLIETQNGAGFIEVGEELLLDCICEWRRG